MIRGDFFKGNKIIHNALASECWSQKLPAIILHRSYCGNIKAYKQQTCFQVILKDPFKVDDYLRKKIVNRP